MAYSIEPATLDDVRWIAELEALMYSADAVPFEVLGDWYLKNPRGFWILKRDGRRVGHIDLLPVKPEALEKFVRGEIVEREIRGVDLYSPADRSLARKLYVESVAVSPAEARPGLVSHLLSRFHELVDCLADPNQVSAVYAIAATGAGQRFLNHLGFSVVQAGRDRKDGHDLFAAQLTDLGKPFIKTRPQSVNI
jgi:hypothetical protein